MSVKFGVVVFPGSNCDHDAYYSVKKLLGYQAEFLWHKERELKECNAIILPGGFSYGDYLRTGAIARFSPIMESVIDFANNGGIVIGICNGFQILLEAGLLPGVMLKNKSLQFVSKDVYLSVENNDTVFTSEFGDKKLIKIPVAHGEGNYFADDETLRSLKENNQIVFRYVSAAGECNDESNFNGSTMNIAGIVNKEKNVLGMMPHPERCCNPILGNSEGSFIFNSIAKNIYNIEV